MQINYRLEKIFWTVILLIGIGWAIWFIPDQFKLWKRNPPIITKLSVDLSEVPVPAITIVSPCSTKFAIAEHLGNYMDPENLPKGVCKIRKLFLNCSTILKKEQDARFAMSGQTLKDRDYSDLYFLQCFFHQTYPKLRACKVSFSNCKIRSNTASNNFTLTYTGIIKIA